MPLDTQQSPAPSSQWKASDYNKPIGPIARIIAFVAREYNTTPAKLRHRHLDRRRNEPRDVARWLACIVSGKTIPQIGIAFECAHPPVHLAVRRVDRRRAADDTFRAFTDDLLARVPR